jgi:hypothetical protein
MNTHSTELKESENTKHFDGFMLRTPQFRWWHQVYTVNTPQLMRDMKAAKNSLGKPIFYLLSLSAEDASKHLDWGRKDVDEQTRKKEQMVLGAFAHAVKDSGLTGICVDMEPYGEFIWRPKWVFGEDILTQDRKYEYATYGREFGSQVWGKFPACELLIQHGGPFDSDPEKYALYPYFLAGLLEALYDNECTKGQLHILLERTYSLMPAGQYDTIVKDTYEGVRNKAREIFSENAVRQWESNNCGIALGAWPLGEYSNNANRKRKNPDFFKKQLDAFKEQQTSLGDKPHGPGKPKYAWVYGENNAWLKTASHVASPYVDKVKEWND